jgi:phasin family protein
MTMANPNAEINAFLEASQKAMAPLVRFSELSARAVERAARFQYEVAGDALNFALANLHTGTQAKDVPSLMQKSAELANQFVEKQAQRSQDLVKLAGEYQAEFTHWFDKLTTELPVKAVKLGSAKA